MRSAAPRLDRWCVSYGNLSGVGPSILAPGRRGGVGNEPRLRSIARGCLRSGGFDVTDRNVTHRNAHGRPLTELQQAILDFIWAKGPATSEQVREALRSAHPLKDSSIRTLLRRLESRGYVSHQLMGNAFVYRAHAPSSRVAARAVRHIIERFWSGSVEQFLIGMVDE